MKQSHVSQGCSYTSLGDTYTIHQINIAHAPLTQADKWFHAHPELSFCEAETAAAIGAHLESLNAFEIHAHIGGHGLAAVMRNGSGKTVLLRADTDALPVQEQTGLAYASTKRMRDVEGVEKPVMHACGHAGQSTLGVERHAGAGLSTGGGEGQGRASHGGRWVV